MRCSLDEKGIGDETLARSLENSIEDIRDKLKNVLIIPPDMTRLHSGAGKITRMYYNMLKGRCQVDILPALGTHDPVTESESRAFFGEDVPFSALCAHNWRQDVVKIGEIPADYVKRVSGGLMSSAIDVEINRRLLDPSYDLILSVGQVVPHEVVGMANYSKNIFVGCGGSSMINASHMLGAVYGMERVMGRDYSPVRQVFDYAEEHFIKEMPLRYVLTVTTQRGEGCAIHGLYIGRERRLFEEAVRLSQEKNINYVDSNIKKVVVYLDEKEFKSMWLGNKAIYRTRMAIADGGELIILAPGIRKFGEDPRNDELVRKYGYVGRDKVLQMCKTEEALKSSLSVAAHLIHGSSDGRFTVTYAVRHLSKEAVEGVGFQYMPYDEAARQYNPQRLKDGYNVLPDGEKIYYISNPALGLWAERERLHPVDSGYSIVQFK